MRAAVVALAGLFVATACAAQVPSASPAATASPTADRTAAGAPTRAAATSTARATVAPTRAAASPTVRLTCPSAPPTPAPYTLSDVPFSVEIRPLVATVGCDETFVITIRPSTPVGSVTVQTPSGQNVSLQQTSANVFSGTVRSAQVLGRWTASQGNHATFEVMTGDRGEPFFQIGVRHSGVPDTTVTKLAADAQATARVLNLYDPSPGTRFDTTKYTKRLYQLYGDDFDLLNIVQARATRQNSTHTVVKNTVTGIGLTVRDSSAAYGSPGRLVGITQFPILSQFDMASHTFVHETGHQWINYLTRSPLGPNGGGHWPYSTLATGVMGFSIGGGQGGTFSYRIEPAGGTRYRLTELQAGIATTFHDIDLYLMGLLPPERVELAIVFTDQRASAMTNGAVLEGVRVTAQDLIAAYGARVPDAASSKKELAVGTIVVSHDRLLDPQEMAYLEHMAARGELRDPVLVSAGRLVNMQNPWYVATKGLSTIDARMRPKGR